MTYPSQPNPYGGPQPAPAQYPGQYPPVPQHPYTGPGGSYGGYPGGGPPPPKKNRTGIVILIVGLVALTVVGVTGVAGLAYFLGSDGGGGGGTSADLDGFVQELVAATNGKDVAALRSFTCVNAKPSVGNTIDSVKELEGARLVEVQRTAEATAVVIVEVGVAGTKAAYQATVANEGGKWCWQDVVVGGGPPPGPGGQTPGPGDPTGNPGGGPPGVPTGGPEAGVKFVEDFLAALNAGDGTRAAGMMCADSINRSTVMRLAGQRPNLKPNPATMRADSSYTAADLSGTVGGKPISRGRVAAFLEPTGWCVQNAYAS